MILKVRRLQGSLCVCRKLLFLAMKLIPSFRVLVLLGVGSLVLLFHLLQQKPGEQLLVAPRWPVEKDAVEPMEVFAPGQFLSGGEKAEQQQRLVRTLESRRYLLEEACAKYQEDVVQQVMSRRQVSPLLVEDRSRLLYCSVPKVGCSNWKRVLMVLAGTASSIQDIPHYKAHFNNHLQGLNSYDNDGIAQRLRSYTKVLFIREPLERLVSAYRDKFENPSSYHHHVYGRAIISRYRVNATQTALSTGDGVTFREFIQYLMDKRRPVGLDIHWKPTYQVCNPCLLHYDFIGRFEDMEEEANFLLRKIGAPANLTFPTSKDRNPQEERTSSRITQKYFSQLSATERQGAYDFFKMDYLLFQYPKPFQDLH